MFEFLKRLAGISPREAIRGGELGATGTEITSGYISDDYNSSLQFPSSIDIYEQMRRSDATVAATLRGIKQPILSAEFFIEPASDDPKDIEVAEWIHWQLFEKLGLQSRILPQVLLYFDFGFMLFEKVYEIPKTGKAAGKVCLVKLAPRLPKSVNRWLETDESSEVGVEQDGYRNDKYKTAKIPYWKLVRFTNEQEGANYEGISVLRPAYKHWKIKSTLEKIGAIAAERGSIGIPMLKRTKPGTPSDEEKTQNKKVLQNVKANKEAYIDLGEGNEFEFATPKGGFDFHPQLLHHDRQISKAVLAQFLDTGASGNKGGYAQTQADQDFFFKSIESHAKYIVDRLQELVINEIVDYNFDVEDYPKLRFKDIKPKDNNTFSVTIQRLVQSGALTPDLDVENHVRHRLGLPPLEEKPEQTLSLSDATDFPSKGDNEKISLKNSKHPQFDRTFAERIKKEYPSVWKKGGNIRGNTAYTLWGKARAGQETEGVLSWIKEREAWAARHKENKNIEGVVAAMKWGVVVSRGESYMKSLINDEVKKLKKKLDSKLSRELTLAEEKIDIDKYRREMDRGERDMERTGNKYGNVLIADIRRRAAEFYDNGKFGVSGKSVKDAKKKTKSEMTETQLRQYEFGKTETVREVGEDGRIATPKETRALAKDSSKVFVDTMENDMEKEAKTTVLSSKQKGIKKSEAIAAVVAGLTVIKNRQASLFGSLQSTGMINRGIAEVHRFHKDKIWGEQYSSIIDDRTTNMCLSLDGRVEKGIGKLPQPPLHGNCFTSGHKIKTRDGEKNIQDMNIGDEVLTHELEYKKVEDVMSREYSGDILSIYIGDKSVVCTPDHPFLTERGWILAKDLTIDDTLFHV